MTGSLSAEDEAPFSKCFVKRLVCSDEIVDPATGSAFVLFVKVSPAHEVCGIQETMLVGQGLGHSVLPAVVFFQLTKNQQIKFEQVENSARVLVA